MKQILTIIADCRGCPNYAFQSSYPGGVEFVCYAIDDHGEHKLIPNDKKSVSHAIDTKGYYAEDEKETLELLEKWENDD